MKHQKYQLSHRQQKSSPDTLNDWHPMNNPVIKVCCNATRFMWFRSLHQIAASGMRICLGPGLSLGQKCFEVRLVIIWQTRMRTAYRGNTHALCSQSLTRYVSKSHTHWWMWFHASHDIVAEPVSSSSCCCEIIRFRAAAGRRLLDKWVECDCRCWNFVQHRNAADDAVVQIHQIHDWQIHIKFV